eukprot:scaffold3742_cov118-Cylindrotheca_fusiformis.AAC.1
MSEAAFPLRWGKNCFLVFANSLQHGVRNLVSHVAVNVDFVLVNRLGSKSKRFLSNSSSEEVGDECDNNNFRTARDRQWMEVYEELTRFTANMGME